MPYWSEKMLNILREFRIPYPDNIIKIIAPLGDVGTAEYFRDTLGVPLTVEEMIERMDAYALDKYSNTIELKAGVYDYLQALKNAGCSINSTNVRWPSYLFFSRTRIGSCQYIRQK